MKRYTELLPKRINILQDELIKDLELNDINLHDKCMRCPGIKAKWLQIKFEEEALLRKLEEGYDKKHDEYISKYGSPGVPKFKIEAEIKKEESLIKLKEVIKTQKDINRYLDAAYKIVSSFNFEISNATKILQLEN